MWIQPIFSFTELVTCNLKAFMFWETVAFQKGILKNLTKFTGKHLCYSLFLNKAACLSPATLLKKRHWHRCFPRILWNFDFNFKNTSSGCFCNVKISVSVTEFTSAVKIIVFNIGEKYFLLIKLEKVYHIKFFPAEYVFVASCKCLCTLTLVTWLRLKHIRITEHNNRLPDHLFFYILWLNLFTRAVKNLKYLELDARISNKSFKVILTYRKHPIMAVIINSNNNSYFRFSEVGAEGVYEEIKIINPRKSAKSNNISITVLKENNYIADMCEFFQWIHKSFNISICLEKRKYNSSF